MLIALQKGNSLQNLFSYSGAGTVNEPHVVPGIMGDFAASLEVANMDRTTGDETLDVKIQESPDPDSVADGDAVWYDLVTFTQVATSGASTEKIVVTTPHFGRLRLVVTLAGTTPSADVKVLIEGLRVGSVNRGG